MRIKELLSKLNGIQTIESVMSILDVNRTTAIYHIYRLRKKGYVKTKKLNNQNRVYNISYKNKFGGTSYIEVINSVSPIKLAEPEEYKIYGTTPRFESALIFGIKSKSVRTILASLFLFKKIKDFKYLSEIAKENKVERTVGALYDVARLYMKTRRMPKSIMNSLLPEKEAIFEYIIEGLTSKSFESIEQKWKVFVPFNTNDLEEYV